MQVTTLQAHEMFLDGVRKRIVALQDEVEVLRPVEAYHAREVERLRVSSVTAPSGNKEVGVQQHAVVAEGALSPSATKYEAAEIAIRTIGRESRMPEIVSVLLDAGYGRDLDRRMLSNSLYSAMDRKKETFERGARGLWTLREWAGRNGK